MAEAKTILQPETPEFLATKLAESIRSSKNTKHPLAIGEALASLQQSADKDEETGDQKTASFLRQEIQFLKQEFKIY